MTYKVCLVCREEKKILAKDMCCSCYKKDYNKKNPHIKKKADKNYYKKHKSKILKQQKEKYYNEYKFDDEYKQRRLKYKQKWRKQNKHKEKEYNDNSKEYRHKYYKNNRQKILQKHKNYYLKNKSDFYKRVLKRNEKKKGINDINYFKSTFINKILETFNNKCYYCGITNKEHKKTYNKRLGFDHIEPLSKGNSLKNNVCVLCIKCNNLKGVNHPTIFFSSEQLEDLRVKNKTIFSSRETFIKD